MKDSNETKIKISIIIIIMFCFYGFLLFKDNDPRYNAFLILPWGFLFIILWILPYASIKKTASKIKNFLKDTSLYLIILVPFIFLISVLIGYLFVEDINSGSYIIAAASIITVIIGQIITNSNVNKQIKHNEKNMMFQMEYMSMKRALVKLNYFIDGKMKMYNNTPLISDDSRLSNIFKLMKFEDYFIDLPDKIRIIINKNIYLMENPHFIHIYENEDCFLIPYDLIYLKEKIKEASDINDELFINLKKIYGNRDEIIMYNLTKKYVYKNTDFEEFELTDEVIKEKVDELKNIIKIHKIRKLIKKDIEKNY